MFKDKLTLQYQPIVDMTKLELVRYEALSRHPSFPNIEAMINELEKQGKISELDIHTLSTAIAQMNKVPSLSDVPVAINLSAISLVDEKFQDAATKILAARPARLVISLEITESAPISDMEIAANFVKRMQRAGCTVGMDDFGDGYTHLDLMDKLNLDYLKLSSHLTRYVLESDVAVRLIKDAVAMANERGVEIVAEHVDNIRQYLYLRDLGIHYGQGWLFAKAAPPIEDVARFNLEMQKRIRALIENPAQT